ncbi:hypothetical protein K5X82_10035 [Halosquirtibacter xylanolyticus]|uniref:hypothetical protein n=1 Tax=Halosquirtibacter xylanolyticus TaxID=3374599 RepID=UPI00374802D2|nr:hypothetical protein K5X82_10035 [Prolixibacteraceae bacterium]
MNQPLAYIHLISSQTNIKITIQNLGIGPLIVKNTTIETKDGVCYSDFKKLLLDSNFTFKSLKEIDEVYTAKEYILGPNKERTLLSYTRKNNEDKDFEKLKKILGNYGIHIDYEDIFKQNYPFDDKPLDLFSRS